MLLTIKEGVSVKGLRPEIIIALFTVASIFDSNKLNPMRLTSGTEGKHSPGSLHYVGLAIDIGLLNIPQNTRIIIRDSARDALGLEYDVVLESDHLHIEYQPK